MQIIVDELAVEVIRKEIKNVHLAVLPPDGRVRVSAPERVPLDTLCAFVRTRQSWIKGKRNAFTRQEREAPRRLLDRETHMVWGERRYLRIVHVNGQDKVGVRLIGRILELHVRPSARYDQLARLLDSWYRSEVEREANRLIKIWSSKLRVQPNDVFVRRMRTKWGSCNPTTRNIRLNTELGTKPIACLEYILVHELCHLIEPTHNCRFRALLGSVYPTWRQVRCQLNDLPLQTVALHHN